MTTIFLIIILIMSVVVHEVAHGYAADWLGDPTARYAGRLTLNPLKHLDWFGSVILPTLLALLGGLVFGWAKPVPYNPYNLRGGKWGPAYVALAGPATNLSLALGFSIVLRLAGANLPPAATSLMSLVVLINLMLAVFNLLPIAPLDGSKLLFALLPARWYWVERWCQRHQLVLLVVLILIIINTNFLDGTVFGLFRLFTGQG